VNDIPSTAPQPPRHCIACGSPAGSHLSWCPTLHPPQHIQFTPPAEAIKFPSLRDYFAAKALSGLLDAAMPMTEIAEAAYQMADLMLKARSA
jgi:hypothetical protein